MIPMTQPLVPDYPGPGESATTGYTQGATAEMTLSQRQAQAGITRRSMGKTAGGLMLERDATFWRFGADR
jgi:hypothetical protein